MGYMPKILVEPIASESFGVRSMATLVKTPDTSIVMDPGCSLGQRVRLDPHPREYEALFRANQRLVKACENAECLTISHFHYDHLKPFFTDYHFILTNRELAEIIYTDKIILAKDYRENINTSQRKRGYFFNKFAKKIASKLMYFDGQKLEIGQTTIQLSRPLPHGAQDSKQGFVVASFVEYEDEIFGFATVQGPIVTDTLHYLQSFNPTILYVGGPPLYLKGYRILETTLDLSRRNMSELAKSVPTLLVDHHLLRDVNWEQWLSPVYQAGFGSDHWVGTAADYATKPVEIFEANRKALYSKDPPSEEFVDWCKRSDEFKKSTLPPNLPSPF
jgi:predicted metallo-beta-lactamase superfamily hydrolase